MNAVSILHPRTHVSIQYRPLLCFCYGSRDFIQVPLELACFYTVFLPTSFLYLSTGALSLSNDQILTHFQLAA